MNALREPSERTEAVRRLLIETVEASGRRSAAGRRNTERAFRWLPATAGAVAVAVTSVAVGVGITTGSFGPATSGSESSSTSSGSRVKLYGSFEELIADSSAALAGTVISEERPADGSGYSRWVLRVDQVYSPEGLGGEAGAATPMPEPGSEVLVRHFGGGEAVTSTGQALTVGQRYLLFLTPTGIPAGGATEFFITGAGAGAYVADGDGFRRISADGDRIPQRLTVEDLED